MNIRDFPLFRGSAKFRWLAGSAVLLAFMLAFAVFSATKTPQISASDTGWTTSGNAWTRGGWYPTTEKTKGTLAERGPVPWASWSGSDANTGTLTSPVFPCPRLIGFAVSGYPTKEHGASISLHSLEDGRNLTLRIRNNVGETWQDVSFLLPPDLWGKRVQLKLTDSSKALQGWFGITTPYSMPLASGLTGLVPTLGVLADTLIRGLLLLLIGVPLAIAAFRRFIFPPWSFPIFVALCTSIVGTIIFYAYLASAQAGTLLAIADLIFMSALAYRYRKDSQLVDADTAIPIAIAAIYVCAAMAFAAVNATSSPWDTLAEHRFFSNSLPPDDQIPHMFAERLYSGLSPRHLIGDWLSSDRPPLQTGLVLSQWFSTVPAMRSLDYQAIGTCAQGFAILGVWALFRAGGLDIRRAAACTICTTLSGFFLINTVYVWPKLLPAGLFLGGFALILDLVLHRDQALTRERAVAAAIFVSVAATAHAGVLFALPAFAILWLIAPNLRSAHRALGASLLAFVLVSLPWSAYQRFYEPPGDRLAKWHLAGVISIDDRTFSQALRDSYSSAGLETVLQNKIANAQVLANFSTLLSPAPSSLITGDFFTVLNALGFLNVGWLFLPFAKRYRTFVTVCLAGAGLAIFCWTLAMFGPATTVIHQGSYATQLLLTAGLVAALAACGTSVLSLSIAVMLIRLLWVYFFGPSQDAGDHDISSLPNLSAAGLSLLCFVCLAAGAIFYQSRRQALKAPPTLGT